jgi:hypothetical protein
VPLAFVVTGGTSLSPERLAVNMSVVAKTLGMFVIIVVDVRTNTEAIAKIAAQNVYFCPSLGLNNVTYNLHIA